MPQQRKTNVRDVLAADPPKIINKNGLRCVLPYYYVYQTYAKERWFGRKLVEVCTTEFRDRSKSYYEWAIQSGIATINREKATLDSALRNGDLIQNKVHAHEPPVVAELPVIIYRDDEKGWLVVSKPGSMPVHPTGRYRKNTLLEILKDEHAIENLYCCNRLDRLTSGVMVIGTKKAAGSQLGAAFMKGSIKKEYIAKVIGKFPDREVVDEPIITVDRQMGLVIRHKNGKSAKTIFERMSYDEATDTSVVYCQPLTGRTHQLRVHLQYLGHPIANDPLYSGHDIWGEKRGKGGWPAYSTGRILDEIYQQKKEQNAPIEVLEKHMAEDDKQLVRSDQDIGFNSPVELDEEYKEVIRRLRAQKDESDGWARWRDVLGFDSKKANDAAEEKENLEKITQGLGGYCPTCFIPLIEDPPREKLFIYLHATRYTSPEWCFEAPLPNWIDEQGRDWWEENNEVRKSEIQKAVNEME
ncbi:pseudouridine synthase, partial [Wallemia mellicola CBS 633.66]